MYSRFLMLSFGVVLLSPAIFGQNHGDAVTLDYKVVADWLKLPQGRTEIGSMHGDVAVSSANEVYISVQGSVRQNIALLGPNPGLQVYAPDGKFLRNVPNAPSDFHGFIIHKEAAGEFIYGTRLAAIMSPSDQARVGLDKQAILKMTLDGRIVQVIPPSAIPDQFKNKAPDGRPFMRLTQVAVAPNGDIYATDGYETSYVHRFDRTGKYVKSFGGKAAPYNFNILHKIAIDTRFTPPRIIGCDRANGRVVHMSLDGDFLGVVAQDMNTPAAVAIHGEYAAIAELRPGMVTSKKLTGKTVQVSILDKAGKIVAVFGTNAAADEIGTATTDPSKWRAGALMAPHGIAFNGQGDVFVSEFNQWGRVQRFNLQQQTVAQQR
jgi:hypothetical protein